ncbi:hypothetical protein [Streptomyces sp. 43Y-GA-1]|uniref:hypothetical protein n=1 Tax=Streptomyces sp. 43Y-GA-1 TaxID=2939435 RepID=UPI0020BE056B|nr:hypothetical protein [Streptomyces sp. 43Y-GA-1]MCL6292859.1 hypothetical protein [Streptomyces sp. 43Y-GA-1]
MTAATDRDTTLDGRVLGIVERAYRGAVEKQFFDVLYMAVELHRQLGGMDILLRGPAVTCALRAAETAPLTFGGRVLDTLSDQRRDLRALLAAGVRVLVQEEDLTDLGLGPADLVDAAVRPVTSAQLSGWWPHYRMVSYL